MAVSKPLAVGAAVLAAVPSVMSGAIPVNAADPMTFEEWMEYYNVSTSDIVVADLWNTDPYFPIYYTMIMNIFQMPYINGVPIDPASYDMRAGFYLRDGVRHRGSVTLWSRRTFQNGGNSGSMPLFSGDDCSISVTVEPVSGNTEQQYYIDYGVDSASHPRLYIASALSRRDMHIVVTAPGFEYGTFATTMTGNYFNYVYLGQITGGAPVEIGNDLNAVLGFGGYPSTRLLGEAAVMPQMPTSDAFPTITAENAADYVSEMLNPWMMEQAPQLEPYLLTPAEPYEPIYPTEFADGIPKSWTVENPRLPSYSLDLQLPTADFESVDVSPVLEEHATGIGFWWQMLTYLLDSFGVKELFIFAMVMGLLVTVLTRLGR